MDWMVWPVLYYVDIFGFDNYPVGGGRPSLGTAMSPASRVRVSRNC